MGIAMNYSSILFVFLLWSMLVFSQQSSTQKSVMLNLFHFLHNPENYYDYDEPPKWNASTNPCRWEGVICTNNSVTQLHLSYSNYNIRNSSVISIACQIQTLQVVNVSYNSLDSIPDDFFTICGKLPRLKSIDFSWNYYISGNLPSFNKGGFTSLEFLDLSHNHLNGSIEAQFDGLVALKSLKLSSNQLTGSIPSNLFGNLKVLQELDLSHNSFQGRIQEQFVNCNNLRYLDLSSNELTGTIPADLGLCQELLSLNLAENRLSGQLPKELGNLKHLQVLNLYYNNFGGSIPINIGNLDSLIELQLNNNLLGGNIPLISKNIQILDLSNNSLSGGIPSQLNRFDRLIYLDLSSNNLSGPIPTTIQKFGYQAFDGNYYLCGYPVEFSRCHIADRPEGGDDSSKQQKNEGKDSFYIGLYVSIGIGFYLGFWGVFGSLVLKHSWRHAFFNFIDTVYNRIYVTIAIYVSKFQRISQTC